MVALYFISFVILQIPDEKSSLYIIIFCIPNNNCLLVLAYNFEPFRFISYDLYPEIFFDSAR